MSTPPRSIRAQQTLLTSGFISKIGLALIAAPALAYVFDLPGHVAGVQSGTWPLQGLWWVVLGLYLHVLGFALARSVR
ncbi:MAG: hypothetical protein ACRYHQ_11850 [Janthinobacterium lividum]